MNLTGRFCPLLLCVMTCSIAVAQPPAQQSAPQTAPQAVSAPEPESIERMFSISAYYWLPSGGPKLRGGKLATTSASHDLALPQKPSRAYGIMLTVPTKGSTRLEISYTNIKDKGNTTAATDLGVFGATIPKGEPLQMDYSLRHFKLSWNYLTYPNPPENAKLRIKTLWEFHMVQVYPGVVESVTDPTFRLSENQRILLPAVGLGLEYVASKRFRMELRGSGMAIPHGSSLGDAEATAVGRFGSLEVFAGGKFFHFRTSPKKRENYVQGNLWGPELGLRWVFK